MPDFLAVKLYVISSQDATHLGWFMGVGDIMSMNHVYKALAAIWKGTTARPSGACWVSASGITNA